MSGCLQISLCCSALESQRGNSKNLSSWVFFQQWCHGGFLERRLGRSSMDNTGGQRINSAGAPM